MNNPHVCLIFLACLSKVFRDGHDDDREYKHIKTLLLKNPHCAQCPLPFELKHTMSYFNNESACYLFGQTSRPLKSYLTLCFTVKQTSICVTYYITVLNPNNGHTNSSHKATFCVHLKCVAPESLKKRYACLNRRKNPVAIWNSAQSDMILIILKIIQQDSSLKRKTSRSKRTVTKEGTTPHSNGTIHIRNQSQLFHSDINQQSFHEPFMTNQGKHAVHDHTDRSHLSSRSESQHRLQQRFQHSQHQQHLHKTDQQQREYLHQQQLKNETREVTMAAEKTVSNENVTAYEEQMRHFWSRQKLRVEGQYAFMSIVFLVLLTLACLWWLRGFHSRRNKNVELSFNDGSQLLTVKEVLFMKARYLPMFQQKDGLEEIFVHDCGNDP